MTDAFAPGPLLAVHCRALLQGCAHLGAVARAQGCESPAPSPALEAEPHSSAPVPLTRGPGPKDVAYWRGAVPKHLQAPSAGFPQVFSPADGQAASPAAWGHSARQTLDRHLASSGAVILRGLPVHDGEDYTAFMEAVGYGKMVYRGLVSRRRQVQGHDEALTDPADRLLPVHCECTDLARPPDKNVFFCLQSAKRGGESLLARIAAVAERLSHLAPRFAERGGLRYSRWYPSLAQKQGMPDTFPHNLARTWDDWVESDDPREAERYFRDNGIADEVTWDSEGGLHTRHVAQLTQPDPLPGEPLWFNFAHSAGFQPLFEIAYADGTLIEPEVRHEIRDGLWWETTALPLQDGDIMFVDNRRCMHGRMWFDDPDRRLLVWMT